MLLYYSISLYIDYSKQKNGRNDDGKKIYKFTDRERERPNTQLNKVS